MVFESVSEGRGGNGGRQLSAAPVVGPTAHGADDLPTEIIASRCIACCSFVSLSCERVHSRCPPRNVREAVLIID
jgi:hypothetical protein